LFLFLISQKKRFFFSHSETEKERKTFLLSLSSSSSSSSSHPFSSEVALLAALHADLRQRQADEEADVVCCRWWFEVS